MNSDNTSDDTHLSEHDIRALIGSEPCEACGGKGWLNCNAGNDESPVLEVQRCDACEKYPNDEQARQAAGKEARQ